jgi:hypothetical protein
MLFRHERLQQNNAAYADVKGTFSQDVSAMSHETYATLWGSRTLFAKSGDWKASFQGFVNNCAGYCSYACAIFFILTWN